MISPLLSTSQAPPCIPKQYLILFSKRFSLQPFNQFTQIPFILIELLAHNTSFSPSHGSLLRKIASNFEPKFYHQLAVHRI